MPGQGHRLCSPHMPPVELDMYSPGCEVLKSTMIVKGCNSVQKVPVHKLMCHIPGCKRTHKKRCMKIAAVHQNELQTSSPTFTKLYNPGCVLPSRSWWASLGKLWLWLRPCGSPLATQWATALLVMWAQAATTFVTLPTRGLRAFQYPPDRVPFRSYRGRDPR